MEIFLQYNSLWQRDHDDELRQFLANDPHVSEFESEIKSYEKLSVSINSQLEYLSVGPLAIFTGIFLVLFECFFKCFFFSVL